MTWMAEKDVVKHLLRANLHQKQYVDQVPIPDLRFCKSFHPAWVTFPLKT